MTVCDRTFDPFVFYFVTFYPKSSRFEPSWLPYYGKYCGSTLDLTDPPGFCDVPITIQPNPVLKPHNFTFSQQFYCNFGQSTVTTIMGDDAAS